MTSDPAGTERACRRSARPTAGELVQRDTYFGVARGRLKLREDLERATGELILHLRPDESGLRSSSHRRLPVPDPAASLSAARGGARAYGIVTKRRRARPHRNVRIHLDDVEGLGSFVELESVLVVRPRIPGGGRGTGRVVAALGLAGRRDTIAGATSSSYRERGSRSSDGPARVRATPGAVIADSPQRA